MTEYRLWAQTIDTQTDSDWIRIPCTDGSRNETGVMLVARADAAVLAAMLTDASAEGECSGTCTVNCRRCD